MENINIERLSKFLVNAKINTYASQNKMEIQSERPGFDELEYQKEDLYYRDSYAGFFQAPGMEVVRLNDKPVWSMSYSGGMLKEFHDDVDFAKEVFNFLKKALKQVPLEIPFRGPKNLKDGDWEYINEVKGNLKRFVGHEKIFFRGEEVFSQDYIGGFIIDK